MMLVSVNNKAETLNGGEKLFDLLAQLDLADKRGIAVAVNNAIISRSGWDNYKLNENDKVTIIRPTQGG
jgi:sulfur carrier protein